MIIQKADKKIEERQEMRGSVGNVIIEHVLPENEMCGAGRLYAKMIVPPGHSVGNHDHIHEREIYYILKGNAQGMDDGVSCTLSEGDVMITKDGGSHSIRNIGQGDLEVMALILFEADNE